MTAAPASDADLNAAFDAISAREPIFHRPEWGAAGRDFERLMLPDYWEVGASGRRYDRSFVLEIMEQRKSEPAADGHWQVSERACRRLADNVFLFTYILDQGDRVTRRATIWVHHDGDWRIAYHQGTIVSAP